MSPSPYYSKLEYIELINRRKLYLFFGGETVLEKISRPASRRPKLLFDIITIYIRGVDLEMSEIPKKENSLFFTSLIRIL